ncbi:hypothetical protein ACM66B_005698 [Microbotryomycetes sp. NB124-2]
MSDASKTPSEVTALPLQPQAVAGSNDSAPPPSSLSSVQKSAHFVPPRDYSSSSSRTRAPDPVFVLPPAYAPNSTVPSFIRLLAFVVFVVGGTLSATAAWIFKSIIYPRLLKAVEARRQLVSTHSSRYLKLVDSLVALRAAPGFSAICAPQARKEAEHSALASTDPSADEKRDRSQAEEGMANVSDSTAADARRIPAVNVLQPVQNALIQLNAELPKPDTSSSLPKQMGSLTLDDGGEGGKENPSLRLITALNKLTTYIETETYAAVTSSYRPYGAPSNVSSERKVLVEAVSAIKAEIRSVKGALLNRRNFATRSD